MEPMEMIDKYIEAKRERLEEWLKYWLVELGFPKEDLNDLYKAEEFVKENDLRIDVTDLRDGVGEAHILCKGGTPLDVCVIRYNMEVKDADN